MNEHYADLTLSNGRLVVVEDALVARASRLSLQNGSFWIHGDLSVDQSAQLHLKNPNETSGVDGTRAVCLFFPSP